MIAIIYFWLSWIILQFKITKKERGGNKVPTSFFYIPQSLSLSNGM